MGPLVGVGGLRAGAIFVNPVCRGPLGASAVGVSLSTHSVILGDVTPTDYV
jgi:hypothetical protein